MTSAISGASTTISLAEDIPLAELLSVKGNIVIDGNGHIISRGTVAANDGTTYAGGFFDIAKGASLTLRNIILDGGASNWTLQDYDDVVKQTQSGNEAQVQFLNTENDVKANAPLVFNEGTLATEGAVFQNAYVTSSRGLQLSQHNRPYVGAAITSTDGSTLTLGGGTIVKHCALSTGFANTTNGGAVVARAGSAVTIDGATFEGNATDGEGAAIYIGSYDDAASEKGGRADNSSLPAIKNSTFKDNYSYDRGVLFCDRQAIEIADTTFEGNVTSNDGAAIMLTSWNDKELSAQSELAKKTSSFKNVKFLRNRGLLTGYGAVGGAVDIGHYTGAGLSFEDCVFDGNSSLQGGAIGSFYLDDDETRDNSKMAFDRCKFINNSASYGGVMSLQWFDITMNDCTVQDNSSVYGGIAYQFGGNLVMSNCSACDNTASEYGGVAYLWRDGSLTVNNSKVTGNFSRYGAVAAVCQNASLNLKGTTVTGNSATSYGGVAYLWGNGKLTAASSTIANNSAKQGGFIYVYGSDSENEAQAASVTLGDGTVVTGNTAEAYGGAVRFGGKSGEYTVAPKMSLVMQSGSKLYGNTAALGGDDIYSGNATSYAPTITLVDGRAMNATTADGHTISGWFYDLPDDEAVGTHRYQRNASTEQKDLTFTEAGMVALKADTSSVRVSYVPNAGDATGTMGQQEIGVADVNVPLASNAFARAGYQFVGWNTKANGSGISYAADGLFAMAPEADCVLYAQWTPQPVPQPIPQPVIPAEHAKPAAAKTVSDASPAGAQTPVRASEAQALPATSDAPVAPIAALAGVLGLGGVLASRRALKRAKHAR